jgi:polysaccharide export outer membrane protein
VPTDTYLLGPGDRVLVDIFEVPEHSGERQVLIDGAVHLNWVGGVPVQGMTLGEAARAIAAAYDRHLYDPLVTLTLVSPRPLRVSVAGAVNRPGTYVVAFTEAPGSDPDARWPTVTQALQQAGGITQFANVRQVRVERQQSVDTSGSLDLDLWALLQSGDLSQDIALRDGDSIWVPTTTDIDPTEAQGLASASFSPAIIRVNVVGEVPRPGTVEVPPNTPLNQALLAAGGFDNSRAETGSVQLVRLNPDGSVSQRAVPVDFTQGINEETNPILYANDVIIVGRSGNAQFSDSFDGVLDTIGKIFPFFFFF